MSLSVQFTTLLAMIGMGSLFGAMLDTYQRFLQRGRRKRWLVFLNDILFWLIQALLIFYVLFLVNYGEIRFYLILALICGFAAYQSLFKGLYLKGLEGLIRFVKLLAGVVWRTLHLLVYQPLKGIYLLTVAVALYLAKLLLALVKAVNLVIIWTLKTVFTPFAWLMHKVIPASWKDFFSAMKPSIQKAGKRSKKIWQQVSQYFQKK